MAYNDFHLSDQDLVMSADGELPEKRRRQVAGHLAACWSCRERMRTIEGTISEFVRARNHQLEGRVAPAAGPRALLRARFAETSRMAGASRGVMWRLGPAAAAFFSALVVIVIIFQSTVSAEGPRPKAGLTPGETRPITRDEICRTPDAQIISKDIPEAMRRLVFAEYGIDPHAGNFEVDYLITPDLGGTESIRNLWPQPYSARWNAHVKDRLEQRLHQLVCGGKLDLATAQHDIAVDWIGAYKKYLGTGLPR